MPQDDAAPTQPAPFTAYTPLKVGKFAASKMVVRESWALLKQDKEIMWFPVLSALTSLVALAVMGVLFFFLVMGGDVDNRSAEQMNVVGYVLCFIYYVVMFFITNFFQAGIYTIAHARMNGRDLSLGDGLRGAQAAAGKIFVWSLISATVGMVLRTIAERSKIIGKIVAVVLGAAWNILTYFSLPALVISNVSVKESFKLSAATIRKTWGETIIVNVGVGLFFGLTLFGGLALGIGTMILAPSAPVILAVSVLMVVYAVMLIIISSALDAIFKLALYEYAQTGTIPGGFSPDLIRGAVRGGKE